MYPLLQDFESQDNFVKKTRIINVNLKSKQTNNTVLPVKLNLIKKIEKNIKPFLFNIFLLRQRNEFAIERLNTPLPVITSTMRTCLSTPGYRAIIRPKNVYSVVNWRRRQGPGRLSCVGLACFPFTLNDQACNLWPI